MEITQWELQIKKKELNFVTRIEEDFDTEYALVEYVTKRVDVLVDKSILYRVQGSVFYIRKPILSGYDYD